MKWITFASFIVVSLDASFNFHAGNHTNLEADIFAAISVLGVAGAAATAVLWR